MAFWESDEDLKKKKMKEVQDTLIPFFTEKFEKIAKANNGHLALGRVFMFYFNYIYNNVFNIL